MTGARLFLGVDGGGTRTRAVVVDAEGQVRGRGSAGPANQEAVGIDAAVAAVCAATRGALAQAGGVEPCAAARIGLAGVDHAADSDALLPMLAPLADHIRLTNDAELLLDTLPDRAGASAGAGAGVGMGVALIAGTGSIALARGPDGLTRRAGGWGHVFGDEGSGYGIGTDALRAVARAADGRDPPTMLTSALLHAWSLAEPAALIPHVYALPGKAAIAGLARLVLDAAAAGDLAARRILATHAGELARTAQAVAERTGFSPPTALPLALGGGLLLHAEPYREMVLASLEGMGYRVEPTTLVDDPALAAALAAWGLGATDTAPGSEPPQSERCTV